MAQEIADSKLIDTWSSSGLIVKPDISKIIEGWQLGEQPPHEYMNWLQNTFGSKLNHILKNGVVKWDGETEYLAGSSVQHNGNVWLCKANNTNSEPTDANANWKRIITVESLTTVLNGYVKNSGDEDIDGIKNFLESPIVPTPTTGTQAANKDYADLKVALASFIGTNQNLAKSGYQKLPGGLIIQWDVIGIPTSGVSYTVNLPIAFPVSPFMCVTSHQGIAADVNTVGMATNTEITLAHNRQSLGGALVAYLVIGY